MLHGFINLLSERQPSISTYIFLILVKGVLALFLFPSNFLYLVNLIVKGGLRVGGGPLFVKHPGVRLSRSMTTFKVCGFVVIEHVYGFNFFH